MLKDMLQVFSQYKLATAILVIFIIITVVLMVITSKASRKRTAERNAVIKKLEEERKLRAEYKSVSDELITNAPDNRLLFGIAANIQQELETKADMNYEFDIMPDEKKLVYALNFVFEDTEKALSDFFRANGKPLTPWAKRAVKDVIGEKELTALFNREYEMFDPDNEDTSLINSEVERIDSDFSALMAERKNEYLKYAAEFIRENKEIFITA